MKTRRLLSACLSFGLLLATPQLALAQATEDVIPAFDITVRFAPTDPLQTPRWATAIGANFGECRLFLELPDGSKWLVELEVDDGGDGNQVEMEISDLSLPVTPPAKSPQTIFRHEFALRPDGHPQTVLELSKGSVEVTIRRKDPQPPSAR